MSIMTSNSFPKSRVAWPVTWFNAMFKEQDNSWQKVFKTLSSDSAYEQALSFSSMGLMKQKNDAEAVYWDQASQGYANNYINLMYALGFRYSIMMEKVDKSGGLLKRLSELLAVSCAETIRSLAWSVFVNAFTTTYGDGKALCATDHPMEGSGGGTNANTPAAAGALSEQTIHDARVTIRRWKSDQILMNVMTDMLIFTPENGDEAYRLMESALQPGTANNAKNFIPGRGFFPGGGLETAYIESTDDWFILTDQKANGFKHYELYPVTYETDGDSDRLVMKNIAYMACSFGVDHWSAVYGNAGA